MPATTLGVLATNPLQMAGAYATFAARGQQYTPYTVASITQNGKILYTAPKTGRTAFSATVSDQVTSVLKSVVTDGSGGAAQLSDGRDVAGKTGTTDLAGPNGGRASAWFVGYTPQLSTAVAIWGEKPDGTLVSANGMLGQTLGGGAVAAPLWSAFMNEAVAGTPSQAFTGLQSEYQFPLPPTTATTVTPPNNTPTSQSSPVGVSSP